MATPERLQKNSEKNDDLEKATKYLLESLMDILTAGGPAFSPALNELKALLTSSPLLEAENFKRRAYNLAKTAGDLASAAKGSVEVKDGAPPPAGGVKAKDGFRGGAPEIRKGAPQAPLAKICAAMVGHVVSIRPNHYEAESKTLLNMITAGRPLDEILRALLELVKRLRDDLLEERSKAFKHIGDVLKALEETENDFVSSLEASRSYLSD
ncbi:MAG: hypothetical protein LBS31_10775, partial [Candidatus Adiutrix sp.]|nr:hypothetical protein [Candidatus Adiutrix sp.]